jgi:hypothetical protein
MKMVNEVGGKLFHNVALDHDFSAGRGRLGERSVQTAAPQAPRTQASGTASIGDRLQALATRALNALTPQSVRVESKVFEALKATSAQVGDLLGALSRGPGKQVDGLMAQRIIDGLPQTAAPLTTRGEQLDTVLSAQVGTHLRNMSTPDLLALRDGLTLAEPFALGYEVGQRSLPTLVREQLDGELSQRLFDSASIAMKPALERAINAVSEEAAKPGLVASRFAELEGVAFTVLTAHGESPTEEKKLVLIKQTLDALMEADELAKIEDESRPEDFLTIQFGQLVKFLPDKVLVKLRIESDPRPDAPDRTENTKRIAEGQLGLRQDEREAAFMQAADALQRFPATPEGGGSLRNLRDVTQALAAAAQNLSQLRAMDSLKFPEAVGDAATALNAHLERVLSPERMPLPELTNSQLNDLSNALKMLGVERSSEHIAAEVTRRQEQANTIFANAVIDLVDASVHGTRDLLLSLQSFAIASSQATTLHQQLGMGMDGADSIMQFRADQTLAALRSLDQSTLMSTFAALSAPGVKALESALLDVGEVLVSELDDPNGRAPYDAALSLRSLSSFVKEVLVDTHQLSLPALPDDQSYGWDDLSDLDKQAIADVMSIQKDSGGVPIVNAGLADADMQSSFQSNIRAMADQPSAQQLTQAVLADGTSTGVSDAFWKDLPRANYSIVGDAGPSPIYQKPQGTGTGTEAAGMAAVEQLRDLVGGNDALLMKVSEFSNQNSLAGLAMGLISAHQLRLEDGRTGTLIPPASGDTNVSYTLSSDGAGGVNVDIKWSLGQLQRLQLNDGSLIGLDPRSRAEFTARVQIDSNLQVSTPVPVGFAQQVNADGLPNADALMNMSGEEVREVLAQIDKLKTSFKADLRGAQNEPERSGLLERQNALFTARAQDLFPVLVDRAKNMSDSEFFSFFGLDIRLIMNLPEDHPARAVTYTYMQKLFRDENFDFLQDVSRMKEVKQDALIPLYEKYIRTDSDKQINIPNEMKKIMDQWHNYVTGGENPVATTLSSVHEVLIKIEEEIVRLIKTNENDPIRLMKKDGVNVVASTSFLPTLVASLSPNTPDAPPQG